MLLMGVDCGSTTIKAAIFDESGQTLATGSRGTRPSNPAPGHFEQDMDRLWAAAAEAMAEAVERSGRPPGDIAAIGVTGHGDGLYLTDAAGAPLGNGIMSVDSRGFEIVEAWRADGRLEPAERLSGQRPYPYAATTLLAWIGRHEPERFARIGKIMFCKDWVRACLTGVFVTDPTDASTAFTNARTQAYDPAILDLFGLGGLAPALVPIRPICGTIGTVTEAAAARSGVLPGTPVSGGLHDVTASAIGLGNLWPGALSITAGTFSINEVLSTVLVTDPRWSARAGLAPGQWMNMSISPASSNNMDWFLRQAYGAELATAAGHGTSVWSLIAADVEAERRAEDPLFHPFLYGSPYEEPASAGFFGLRAWHDRGHMLRAVIEGAVFNHHTHALALASAFPLERAGISGGGSASPWMAQLFADVLGLPVDIPEAREIGALGTAIAAGVGVGLYDSLAAGVARACRVAARTTPDPARHGLSSERYARYAALVEALRPGWRAGPAGADGARAP